MTETYCRLVPIGVTLLSVCSSYKGPKSVGVFPSILRLRGQMFILVDAFLEDRLYNGKTPEFVKPIYKVYN